VPKGNTNEVVDEAKPIFQMSIREVICFCSIKATASTYPATSGAELKNAFFLTLTAKKSVLRNTSIPWGKMPLIAIA